MCTTLAVTMHCHCCLYIGLSFRPTSVEISQLQVGLLCFNLMRNQLLFTRHNYWNVDSILTYCRTFNKIAQSNLGTDRVAMVADPLMATARDRSTVFARWRQCARPANTRFHGPTPLTTPNGSLIGLVCFLAYGRCTFSLYMSVSYITLRRPIFRQNLPLTLVASEPPYNTWFLGTTRPNTVHRKRHLD